MKINLNPLDLLLVSLISLILYLWTKYQKPLLRWWQVWRKRQRAARQLRPREPKDCPECALGVN